MSAGKGSLPEHYLGQKEARSRRKIPLKGGWGGEMSTLPPSRPSASFPDNFLGRYAFKKEGESSVAIQTDIRGENEAVADFEGLPEKRRRRGDKVALKKEEGVDGEEELTSEAGEYLPNVPDHVKADLDILMIGSNPGRMSSRKGQHFSHPSNHFYRALHLSDLTPCLVSPALDYTLLEQEKPFFSIGLTNLAARPTRMAHELGKSEEEIGTEILIQLIKKYRPRVGVFVGLGVSRSFESSLRQLKLKENKETKMKGKREGKEELVVPVTVGMDIPLVTDKTLGLGVGLMHVGIKHDEGDGYTVLYAMPSTSGRVTTHQLKEKAACMERARVMTQQLAAGLKDGKQVMIRLV